MLSVLESQLRFSNVSFPNDVSAVVLTVRLIGPEPAEKRYSKIMHDSTSVDGGIRIEGFEFSFGLDR